MASSASAAAIVATSAGERPLAPVSAASRMVPTRPPGPALCGQEPAGTAASVTVAASIATSRTASSSQPRPGQLLLITFQPQTSRARTGSAAAAPKALIIRSAK